MPLSVVWCCEADPCQQPPEPRKRRDAGVKESKRKEIGWQGQRPAENDVAHGGLAPGGVPGVV